MASEPTRDEAQQAKNGEPLPLRTVLIREVMTPGREQTGIAVVLVAASALAFALAGSAFALWARSAAHHCGHNHFTPASVSVDADEAQPSLEPCTAQLIEHSGLAYFRECPDPDVAIQPAHEVVVEEQAGMVVYRIIR